MWEISLFSKPEKADIVKNKHYGFFQDAVDMSIFKWKKEEIKRERKILGKEFSLQRGCKMAWRKYRSLRLEIKSEFLWKKSKIQLSAGFSYHDSILFM